jgi:hypothetical protein
MADERDHEQVYHPNAEPVGEGETKGAACFLAQDRICGPDCMAYLPQVPEGPAYIGEQWAHCMLLVNAERAGKHLVVLASVASTVASKYKQSMAERVRDQTAPKVT